MNELRVLFDRDGDQYNARPVGGVGVQFPLFLEERNFEDLRWYLEDFMDLPDGGSTIRARRIEDELSAWGRRLCSAVFGEGANRALLEKLLAGPEPRVLTIGTDDANLLRLPWELIADEAGALTSRAAVRRQLEEPRELEPRPVALPLRILYIVSRPDNAGFIDPRLTTRSLLDALDPLGANVRVDFCRPPTVARMEELLRLAEQEGDPYDVFHFDGHGTFIPEIQLGGLYFEKDDSSTDLVRADRLGTLLARYKIPLVVLEACRSATVGETAVFRSVAPRLIQAGVSSVLSMGHAVHVEAARRLLDRFYRELARGTTIGHAVSQARAALVAGPERWIEYGPRGRSVALQDWFLPHLYQRGLDEPLFPVGVVSSSERLREFDVFLSHNHADSERVEALARVLSDKHGLRVWLDIWECKSGSLKSQCAVGIASCRYVVVVGSAAALGSKWVEWEVETALALGMGRSKILPIKIEDIVWPAAIEDLLWVDFRVRDKDEDNIRKLARLIRSSDAEDARARRGYRSPARHKDEVGSFPSPPLYQFQGRARELHELERRFRTQRGIVLHAMGGMGKTALATEAAGWWTRSGMFRDGACFVSFEQFVSVERAIQVLGAYLEGPGFEALPAGEQRRRVVELFERKDVLFVWDNFESVLPNFQADLPATAGAEIYSADERSLLFELFRELTSSVNGRGRLLVTCRPGNTGLLGAQRFELQGLARADSLWLLSRVIAKDGLTLDDPRFAKEELNPLLERLADHPLSIELVAPHLRSILPRVIVEDFGKLLVEFRVGAGVERNESLLASLAFSTRRLSAEAQAMLPWLGLFTGGVFEDNLLGVSQVEPERWEPLRAELEATALVHVEGDLQLNDRPYLRFHPTLADAARDHLANAVNVQERFIDVYLAVMRTVDDGLASSNSRSAMALIELEESNYRTAVRWALEHREHAVASDMGETLGFYLSRFGRLRERDLWSTWLANEVRKGGFSEALAARELDEALSLFNRGQTKAAFGMLKELRHRLLSTTDFDPKFRLAELAGQTARLLHASGSSGLAIQAYRDAIRQWESLITGENDDADKTRRNNLSVALGGFANALRAQGLLDEALVAARRGLAIDEDLGNNRSVAVSCGQIANIFEAQGRYEEADAQSEAGIAGARRAADKTLESAFIQHQGRLAIHQGRLSRASSLLQRALIMFQAMNNEGAVMRTCGLMGIVEKSQGRFAEARKWHERSREIARSIGNVRALDASAHNIGVVCQREGEAALAEGRDAEAGAHFLAAKQSLLESAERSRTRGSEVRLAASVSQLARVCIRLGEVDEAAAFAHQAREIHERLGLKEVLRNYVVLAEIARVRGQNDEAAKWEALRDVKREERRKLAAGSGAWASQFVEVLQALSIACARAGAEGVELEPDAEVAIARLEKRPSPMPEVAAFLRRVAAGEIPAVPPDVPKEFRAFLEQLLGGLREARSA